MLAFIRFEMSPRGFALGRIVETSHHHTLACAQQAFAELQKMLGSRRMPLLMDIRLVSKMDPDARNFYAEFSSASVTRLALLTTSMLSKITANFYIGAAGLFASAEKMPVRMFDAEDRAANWLVEAADLAS